MLVVWQGVWGGLPISYYFICKIAMRILIILSLHEWNRR